ncbi:MAG: sulfurtransferase TusA family protein [Rhodobacteraceae bacterium]|nr:sulfurtransferase TusA family protein [Paracoccaceae bacterium]
MNRRLDTLGLLCPLPVLKIQKQMRIMDSGDILTVLADDPASAVDIPFYCKENGHRLVNQSQINDHWQFQIKKK